MNFPLFTFSYYLCTFVYIYFLSIMHNSHLYIRYSLINYNKGGTVTQPSHLSISCIILAIFLYNFGDFLLQHKFRHDIIAYIYAFFSKPQPVIIHFQQLLFSELFYNLTIHPDIFHAKLFFKCF